MARSKITVVGAGNVGATLAQRLAERGYADIVLVDIVEGLPQGKALDMLEAGPIVGYDSTIVGTNGYEETARSSICVITSGVPRKPRMCPVAGIPISTLIPSERIEAIVKRTRDGGAEIVNLLKSGSAYYAPSAAVAEMVDAIMLDRKQILPCAVRLDGEYGIRGLFVGVPVKLGAGGAEEVIELELTDDERAALQRSADSVKELVGIMQI